MNLFIGNAVRTVATSYAVWVGQLAGLGTVYTTWLSSLSPADQVTFDVPGQMHWLGIGISFLTIVGIPIARSLAQNNAPKT